jgi:carboxylesterase type B
VLITAQAQFCNNKQGLCYQEDSCFQTSEIYSQDYKYATVHNIYKSSTASIDLYITIYSPCILPENINDVGNLFSCTRGKRPFILLIHGGGFRTGCKSQLNEECLEFAKRGYVAATIDYRLGWVKGDEKQTCSNSFCFNAECSVPQGDSCKVEYKDSLSFAIYRALQDASAAMRFITHYANKLHIDTGYLYIGGHSAGSIIALNICYTNQLELNRIMPSANLMLGRLTIVAILLQTHLK